jgi:beta-phosphoglucomutase family hydrolase
MRAAARADTDLRGYDAVLFDLDGVITRTASVHAGAWKALFDEYLQQRSAEDGSPFEPFDIATDYVRHVDGRRRRDGVAAFLASRHVDLPVGAPDDAPDAPTQAGLANRKDGYFQEALARDGVEAFDDAVAVARWLEGRPTGVAVVSASESCVPILRAAGLLELFPVRVTGVEANALGLAGKPAPDTFLEAARQLGVEPARAVVVEDAMSGVEAGRAGGFGLVVGVDRIGGGTAAALAAHGADVVLTDLTDLLPG